MIVHRKREYFDYDPPHTFQTVANTPPRLFAQERDWTCAVACIRTLVSGLTPHVMSEDDYIKEYNLIKGPHYVPELLAKGMLTPAREIKTDTDYAKEDLNLKLLCRLLQEKYFIMAESLLNYDHWVVILGYYATRDKEDTEEHSVLIFDPYYDKVRLMIAEEFETMWCSPEGNYRAFVAIK